MDKERLRQRLKNLRSHLSPEDVAEYSRQITNNLWPLLDFAKVYSIHTYLPISQNKEIDSLPLIHGARQVNPNIKIASWDMTVKPAIAKWLDSNLNFQKEVPKNFQYGVILVPLLGFDSNGQRLGYGGGFYDKFLAEQEQALKIGLCYEFGHFNGLPSEEHDVPLDLIVTEKRIYKT